METIYLDFIENFNFSPTVNSVSSVVKSINYLITGDCLIIHFFLLCCIVLASFSRSYERKYIVLCHSSKIKVLSDPLPFRKAIKVYDDIIYQYECQKTSGYSKHPREVFLLEYNKLNIVDI